MVVAGLQPNNMHLIVDQSDVDQQQAERHRAVLSATVSVPCWSFSRVRSQTRVTPKHCRFRADNFLRSSLFPLVLPPPSSPLAHYSRFVMSFPHCHSCQTPANMREPSLSGGWLAFSDCRKSRFTLLVQRFAFHVALLRRLVARDSFSLSRVD